MLAKPTRRLQQSKSSPKLRHTATISMSIQKHSGRLQRLGPTDTYTPHCSHQIIFKVDLPQQSNYLEAGITKPMTPKFYKRK